MNSEESFQHFVTKVTVDIICLMAVGFPILIFHVAGKPYERGFYCDDESLRHPYLDSTVPSWVLYTVGLGLPISVMIVTEYMIYRKNYSSKRKIPLLSKKVPSWLWNCYRHIGVFGFGAACSQLTTDVAKYTVGRLRPHFFDVCRPDINCNDPKYKFVYIENFTCQQNDQHRLKDMRLSFPSGHSSFSAYCMLYIVMYLQCKLIWRGSKLLKHILQYTCILMALYTALTRISDYKHHWSDVLAGIIQGSLVAILVVVFASDILKEKKYNLVKDSPVAEGMNMGNDIQMQLWRHTTEDASAHRAAKDW